MSASFTCPRCGRTSHNPYDARERYCGACHVHVDDAPIDHNLGAAHDLSEAARFVEAAGARAASALTERNDALRERDEARRLARHLAIRLALIRYGRVPLGPPGELQGAEAAMCKHAMGYPEEPDINAPAPWITEPPSGSKP